MARCTAKSKRSGKQCRNHAMANGKCRMHGGKATGAPKGSQNNLKHGIYSNFFSEEEKALTECLELNALDEELKLCKIRLIRALKAECEQGEADDALELIGKTIEPPIIGGVPISDDEEISDIVKKTFAKKDYSPIIDRLVARIQSLTQTRSSLLSQSIDIEMKQIELDKIKSADAEAEAQPVKVVIQVEDARLDDKSETKQATS